MKCPICQYDKIPTLVTHCPNCDVSLVSFKMVDALEEQYVEVVKTKVNLDGDIIQQRKSFEQELKNKNKQKKWLVFLLLLLPFLYYFFGRTPPKETEKIVEIENDSLKIYKEMLLQQSEELKELEQTVNAFQRTRNIRELKYIVKKGDILNDLGKLFYNDSLAGYQIAKDNRIFDVRGLPIGDTLSIRYRE